MPILEGLTDGSRAATPTANMADNVLHPPHRCRPALPDYVPGIPVSGRCTCACDKGRTVPSRLPDNHRLDDLQPHIHRARHYPDIPLHHTLCGCSRQLLCPHNDPIQGHGVSKTQRNRILDDSTRRRTHLASGLQTLRGTPRRHTPSSAHPDPQQTCGYSG